MIPLEAVKVKILISSMLIRRSFRGAGLAATAHPKQY